MLTDQKVKRFVGFVICLKVGVALLWLYSCNPQLCLTVPVRLDIVFNNP